MADHVTRAERDENSKAYVEQANQRNQLVGAPGKELARDHRDEPEDDEE